MILRIPGVLNAEQVNHCTDALKNAAWTDGRITAGTQSEITKRNLQLPESEPEAKALGALILTALSQQPLFISAAVPARIYPPMFNRYASGMGFGDHIDNAVRTAPTTGARYRTDLSCTLFLTAPEDYDGGELVIGDGYSPASVKLAAGDLILYPAGTVHRVEPITRGERWASFFWVQSLVEDPTRRTILYDLDQAIGASRRDLSDSHPAAIALVGVYHNLVRLWARP